MVTHDTHAAAHTYSMFVLAYSMFVLADGRIADEAPDLAVTESFAAREQIATSVRTVLTSSSLLLAVAVGAAALALALGASSGIAGDLANGGVVGVLAVLLAAAVASRRAVRSRVGIG